MTYWSLAACCVILAASAVALALYLDKGQRESVAMAALLLAVVCVLGALGTGVEFVVANLDRDTCFERGRKTGITVEFELLSGCYVRVDNRLVPYDQWVQVTEVKP